MTYTPPYDDAFKQAAIKMAAEIGIPKASIECEIRENTLRAWVAKDNQRQPNAPKLGAAPVGQISNPTCTQAVQHISRSVVLTIPDLHCPFEHPHALLFLQAIRVKYHPTHIVCLGDEADFHAMSRYPHDPNGHSAGHELREAIDHLIPFYREFPQVMVCESNHTIRGHKAAFQSGLPAAFLNHIATVLNAPDGWKWANHWEIDGVRYIHGDAGRSGQYAHMAYLKMFKQNLVIGHIHSFAGINYEGPFWAVNSGCLIDEDKYAFSYARNMPIRPNLGCTIVFGGRWAVFVPMILNNEGRWIGTL